MTKMPADFLRRTPIYRRHLARNGVLGEVSGMACPLRFGADVPAPVMLCDLTALPRSGLKGRETFSWLRGQGCDIGDEDNVAYGQGDGSAIARLGPSEALLLSGLDGSGNVELRPKSGDGARAYPVPRSSANIWFYLCGERSSGVFAKLCGVDLRPHIFSQGAVAQTSIARLNGIVIRHDAGKTVGYHLLADFASAAYLWEVLLDAMAEYGGQPVGLDELAMVEERSQ